MKQKDVVLILVISVISAVFSLLLSNSLISTPKNRKEKVEVVESISSEFSQPNAKYFNKESVNPTKLIEIGDTTNQNPIQ